MPTKQIKVMEAVRQFYLTDADEAELVAALAKANRETFEAVARDEISRLRLSRAFSLRNGEVTRRLERDARRSAASIRQTFNRELRAAARRIRDAAPTQSQSQFLEALTRWHAERQAAKGKSIAVTEAYATQHKAVTEFHKRSGIEARLWFGGSLKCPICAGVAASNPYTVDGARGVPAPIHVNCGDSWTSEVAGALGASSKIWIGE